MFGFLKRRKKEESVPRQIVEKRKVSSNPLAEDAASAVVAKINAATDLALRQIVEDCRTTTRKARFVGEGASLIESNIRKRVPST